MKAILVPTDFSPAANNALEYAVRLSELLEGRIILLNAYHPLLPPNHEEGYTEDMALIQRGSVLEKLMQLKEEVLQKHGADFDIECIAELGFSFDVINDTAKNEKADVIVMGITGKAGPVKKTHDG